MNTECKICGAPTADGAECCGKSCTAKLQCKRIAWDREARKLGVNGYYDRRCREHDRTGNTKGGRVMRKEWQEAKARLGERP